MRGEALRCVSLGSRRNLCCNPAVQQLKTDAAMAETCLELQKNTKSKKAAVGVDSLHIPASKRQRLAAGEDDGSEPCPYHKRGSEQALADSVLGTIMDIEEIRQVSEYA